jgi:hypothetical protein
VGAAGSSAAVKAQQEYNAEVTRRRVATAKNVGETAEAAKTIDRPEARPQSEKAVPGESESKAAGTNDAAYSVDQKAYTAYLRSLETHLHQSADNFRQAHTFSYNAGGAGPTAPLWKGYDGGAR